MPTLLALLASILLALGPLTGAEGADLAVVLEVESLDGGTAGEIAAAVERAEADGAAVLILRMAALRGPTEAIPELMDVVLAEGPVAIVALAEGTLTGSATALALGCGELHLRPHATLGPIETTWDGTADSINQAKLRQLAKLRGRPQAAVLALASQDDPTSYTADEAVEAGLADGIAVDLDRLLAARGWSLAATDDTPPPADDDSDAPSTGRVDGGSGASFSLPTSIDSVAYVFVEDTIDDIQYGYFQRALDTAREEDVDVVVTHIRSPGGYLAAAEEMMAAALAFDDEDDPVLIAFVDNEAISAAAALAYSHHGIYLTTSAAIGDIGVIFQTSEGIEYAPEKIETFMRARLRTLADTRGWDHALLSKMTARNQVLYEVHLADGSVEYVIEDDLEPWLKRHPEVDRDEQVVPKLGEDRLLTFTASEAVEMDMATGLVSDLDQLYAQLGVSGDQVLDLSPNRTERIAWALSSWAPLLAALAILFVILEVKTPGAGLWISLAAITGAAFFVCQYYMAMASNLEVVLVVLGVILFAVEVFTGVTGGLLMILGGMMGMAGLLLAFMPNAYQFDFGDARWADALGSALLRSILALVVATIGILIAITTLPHTRLIGRIAVNAEIRGNSSGDLERGSESLVGSRGTVTAALHPGGWVEIDGGEHSARSEHGESVDRGATVEIVRVQFGELVVRPVQDDADTSGEAAT